METAREYAKRTYSTPEEQECPNMVAMPQIGRKLAQKRATRHSVHTTPPSIPSEYEATKALFKKWEAEAAQMTPEQLAQEDAGWEEIHANLERDRSFAPSVAVTEEEDRASLSAAEV